jgi:hypothetical protein
MEFSFYDLWRSLSSTLFSVRAVSSFNPFDLYRDLERQGHFATGYVGTTAINTDLCSVNTEFFSFSPLYNRSQAI